MTDTVVSYARFLETRERRHRAGPEVTQASSETPTAAGTAADALPTILVEPVIDGGGRTGPVMEPRTTDTIKR